MPAERMPMRCVREILRLKYGCGATDRMIARSIGLARSTVGDYLAGHCREAQLAVAADADRCGAGGDAVRPRWDRPRDKAQG